MENFKFLSIAELKGKEFFIPNYQRGYKWSDDQVKNLLRDIKEFMEEDKEKVGQSYCLQPLVVGYLENDPSRFEVIDGQQRLTTIFLILSALGVNKEEDYHYSMEYETRLRSWDYLQALGQDSKKTKVEEESGRNEDFYHMFEAYELIKSWIDDQSKNDEDFVCEYTQTLLTRVKFIWYHSLDPNPVQVFRRLNDGKIGLTDAELTKALILHCDATSSKEINQRASEWDTFEMQLQDDEFWLFLQNDIKYKKPTRIEWIFDFIQIKDLLGLKNENEDYGEELGDDNHKTFRYFDLALKYGKADGLGFEDCAKKIWDTAKTIMAAISEWYADNELYHYVGYCILLDVKLIDLYREWTQKGMTKNRFNSYLKDLITNKIKSCCDLSVSHKDNNKRNCLPLLLLHNIEEILSQNRNLRNERRYGMGAFYRFPFHLYKKEEKKNKRSGWEVEHISSNSGDADEPKQRAFFLAASKLGIYDGGMLEKIQNYNENSDESGTQFQELKHEIERYLKEEEWTDNDKNKIWNFTLLDSGTNQEYQNAVFPFKRLYIINKEAGYKTEMIYDNNTNTASIKSEIPAISFIPVITKKIFTKAFKDSPKTLTSWTHADAGEYLLDLLDKTKDYLPEIYRTLYSGRKDDESFIDMIISTPLAVLNAQDANNHEPSNLETK